MSTTDNKELVRDEFESIWTEGVYHEERFTDKYVAHGWKPEPINLEQEQEDTGAFRHAFPDIHKEIEDLIAEGGSGRYSVRHDRDPRKRVRRHRTNKG